MYVYKIAILFYDVSFFAIHIVMYSLNLFKGFKKFNSLSCSSFMLQVIYLHH